MAQSIWKIDDGNMQETFEAETGEQACLWAEEWLATGEYGDEGCVVTATVTGPDGECLDVEVTIEADEDALDEHHEAHVCDGHEHEYESPYSVLGGCRENPGVLGGSGTDVSITECCQCGAHRHTCMSGPETSIEYPFGLWPSTKGINVPAWFRGHQRSNYGKTNI
jgi:hypothetical protein